MPQPVSDVCIEQSIQSTGKEQLKEKEESIKKFRRKNIIYLSLWNNQKSENMTVERHIFSKKRFHVWSHGGKRSHSSNLDEWIYEQQIIYNPRGPEISFSLKTQLVVKLFSFFNPFANNTTSMPLEGSLCSERIFRATCAGVLAGWGLLGMLGLQCQPPFLLAAPAHIVFAVW